MKKRIISFIFVFILASLLITSYSGTNTSYSLKENQLYIHYIDVDQGDSILVQVNNKNLLIDAGPKSSRNDLTNYLDNLNIKSIDYVISTHPHEDHIGGMSKIIDTYDIGKFYAPKITHTSKTFESMISSLKNKNLKINIIKRGLCSIDLGKGTTLTVFSPTKDIYETSNNPDYNNYSPIIKLTYYDTSFLFTGDAESLAEKEVLKNGDDISANVLKLGHHGSSTSTSDEFLEKVNPSISIASLGYLNSYGHPHKEITDKLKNKNITLYRTDKDGTIILASNGKSILKI